MGTVVVDAAPLMALLLDERGASAVRERLDQLRSDGTLIISSVNWYEVLCVARRKCGLFVAAQAIARLRSIPLDVVEADERLATFAAELKHRHGLGLGDSFAAGLAFALDAPLLTCDADFLPLVDHGLRLEWVGPEPL